MDQVTDGEGLIRYVLHPESEQQLVTGLGLPMIPIFAMNEGDTRLLLSHPSVEEALRRRLERGWCVLVLGGACKPFAERGLLPACLLELQDLTDAGGQATVTYGFPAEPATRLLRVAPLSPADPADALGHRHLLELRLPDGRVIPDGFVGCGEQVLGLLNGVDTTLLPCLRGGHFTL
jgi:hypothetical protein